MKILAHKAVQDVLRQIFLHGSLVSNEGFGTAGGQNFVKIDFRNAMFFATSNAGQKTILSRTGQMRRLQFGAGPQFEESELRNLAATGGISEPLVDRFQAVVEALPATAEEFKSIVRLHIERAIDKISADRGTEIKILNAAGFVDFSASHYFRPGMSNRIAEQISSAVDSAFSKALFVPTLVHAR